MSPQRIRYAFRILICGFIYFSALASSAKATVAVTEMKGFCASGVYPNTSGLGSMGRLHTWGSYCMAGDQTTGELVTSWFKAPHRIRIYFAGYPNDKDLELALVSANVPKRLKMTLTIPPKESWRASDFEIPNDWRGQLVRLQALDRSVSPHGWFAFSEPIPAPGRGWHWASAAELAARTLAHFLLAALPCLAIVILAVRRGVKSPLVLASLCLTVLGAIGYAAFWFWFASPLIGRATGLLVPIVSIALLIKYGTSLSNADWKIIRNLLSPSLLLLSVTLLGVFACFVYGGMDDANMAARYRFGGDPPIDNQLPFLFANGLIAGKVPSPMIGDWLASDRPPLQTGIFLANTPWVSTSSALDYTIAGIMLQSLWIFAFWTFLSACDVDRRLIRLILAVCLFSGFVFFNSIYLWPKVLAAAYTLAGASLLLGKNLESIRNRQLGSALAAALFAFSLLAHGGALFAIFGLLLLLVILRRIPAPRCCLAALGTLIIVYLPWVFYQKVIDPPGDRLPKWHIAGATEVTKVPFPEVLVKNYRALTVSQIIQNKIENVRTALGFSPAFFKSVEDTVRGMTMGGDAGADVIAKSSFDVRLGKGYRLLSELDVLTFALFGIAAGIVPKFRNSTWRFSLALAGWVGLTILNWSVLMFGPGTTVLHQGSSAIVFLAYGVCLSAAWVVSTGLATALGLFHVVITFVYYVFFLHVYRSDELGDSHIWPGVLISAVLLAVLVAYQLFQMGRTKVHADERLPREVDHDRGVYASVGSIGVGRGH